MTTNVTLTRDGGRFYRATALAIALTWPVVPIALIIMVIALINPLWFREWALEKIVNYTESYSRWRNYKVYTVYLGMDPKVWHTLKG